VFHVTKLSELDETHVSDVVAAFAYFARPIFTGWSVRMVTIGQQAR
jgi:hypothetical protein